MAGMMSLPQAILWHSVIIPEIILSHGVDNLKGSKEHYLLADRVDIEDY